MSVSPTSSDRPHLDRLWTELRKLWIAAGKPSCREIERKARAFNALPEEQRQGVKVPCRSHSTLSRHLPIGPTLRPARLTAELGDVETLVLLFAPARLDEFRSLYQAAHEELDSRPAAPDAPRDLSTPTGGVPPASSTEFLPVPGTFLDHPGNGAPDEPPPAVETAVSQDFATMLAERLSVDTQDLFGGRLDPLEIWTTLRRWLPDLHPTDVVLHLSSTDADRAGADLAGLSTALSLASTAERGGGADDDRAIQVSVHSHPGLTPGTWAFSPGTSGQTSAEPADETPLRPVPPVVGLLGIGVSPGLPFGMAPTTRNDQPADTAVQPLEPEPVVCDADGPPSPPQGIDVPSDPAPADDLSSLPDPSRYDAIERLPAGPTGRVFRVRMAGQHGPEVVIKFLRSDQFATAQAWAALRHRHLVEIIEVGPTADGTPYVVMEYVPGGSYWDRLHAHGPLPAAEVVEVGTAIGGALGYAHSRGVLHGDLKPGNILRSHRGPLLTDFEATEPTGPTHWLTPAYTAPEILMSGGHSTAGDIYGLAATLWTLLSGEPPFGAGTSGESPHQVGERVLETPLPRLTRTDVPAYLVDALVRALAKDSAQRQPSMAALVAAVTGRSTDPVHTEKRWPLGPTTNRPVRP